MENIHSGVFVGPLANENALVITAADFDHSSFGCQDKVKWTHFGDAFFLFQQSSPKHP